MTHIAARLFAAAAAIMVTTVTFHQAVSAPTAAAPLAIHLA